MKTLYITAIIVGLSVMNISYADNAQYKPASNHSGLYYSANSSAYRANSHTHDDMEEAFGNLRAEAWRKQKHLAHLISKDNARKLALAKKPDVKIGMSAGDVLKTRWGTPNYKNSEGNTERWVYGTGEYLLLKNGILTMIAN